MQPGDKIHVIWKEGRGPFGGGAFLSTVKEAHDDHLVVAMGPAEVEMTVQKDDTESIETL